MIWLAALTFIILMWTGVIPFTVGWVCATLLLVLISG